MYTIKQRAVNKYTSSDAVTLSSTGVASISKSVCSQVDITRLTALVSTAVVSTSPCIVTFQYYPVIGSSANAVAIGTLSIPGGTAAGKMVVKDISPTLVVPGGQIVYNVTTAATSSGAASFDFEYSDSPELPGNQANVIVSA